MTGPRIHGQDKAVPADASALGLSAPRERSGRPSNEHQIRGEARARTFPAADPRPPLPLGAREPLMIEAFRGRSLMDRIQRFGSRVVDGEQRVSAQLSRLVRRDPRWRCLGAVPVGINGAHIDHLVIGPGGVFTVDVKSHPGSRVWIRGNVFRVDGLAYPYVSSSRHEALRASRCLTAACGFKVEVEALVVLTGAEEIAIREGARDVHVLDHTALRPWIRSRGELLDAPTVAAVFDAARRSTTWSPLG